MSAPIPWKILSPVLLLTVCLPSCQSPPAQPNASADASGTAPLVATAATGCVAKSIAEMSPTDVIVAVNGVPLTRRLFDSVLAQAVRREAARPGTQRQALPQISKAISRNVVPEFVRRQLLVQEARRLGKKPSREAEDQAAKYFARIADEMGMTPEELSNSPLPQAAQIRDDRETGLLTGALLQEKVYSRIDIPAELVTNAIAAINEENVAVAQKNAEARAMLVNLRARIMAGEDFAALADKHSEAPNLCPEIGGYWGVFERSEIDDRDMSDTIFSLRTNEVSEVLSDDEGFRIVKVLKQTPAVRNENQEVIKKECRELAHILRLRVPSLQNMGPEAMKRNLAKQAAERLTAEYVQELMAKAVIEYPHGTNFWARTGGETNAPARGARQRRAVTPTLPLSPITPRPTENAGGSAPNP